MLLINPHMRASCWHQVTPWLSKGCTVIVVNSHYVNSHYVTLFTTHNAILQVMLLQKTVLLAVGG